MQKRYLIETGTFSTSPRENCVSYNTARSICDKFVTTGDCQSGARGRPVLASFSLLACFLNTTRNHTSNSNFRVHLRSNCALDHFRFQRTSSVSKIFDWSCEQCRFHIRSEITRLSRVLSGKCVLNSKTIGR